MQLQSISAVFFLYGRSIGAEDLPLSPWVEGAVSDGAAPCVMTRQSHRRPNARGRRQVARPVLGGVLMEAG